MPSGGLGDDEDTVAGDSFGNVRQPATLVKSADLQTALAPPDDKDFGTKIYENIGLTDFTPAPVTCVSELLGLRSYFMSQLVPYYLWIIKLSMIEWPTLCPGKEVACCNAQVFCHLLRFWCRSHSSALALESAQERYPIFRPPPQSVRNQL
jgi:hypothetical protein